MLRKFKHYGHPYLKEVNGLLNLATLAFGFFNLLLGLSLFLQSATTRNFFIVTGVFNYQFWGASFFLGGASLLLWWLLNNWAWMRYALLYLLFNKFVWLAALVYRQYENFDANLFLLLFFALTTVMQIGMYFYFPILEKVSTWKE